MASIYLVAAVLVVGLLPLDVFVLGVSDRLIDLYNGRWSRYVDHGERLLAEGRADEATRYLAALDRRFPARHAKHSLDRERERLLVTLGRAFEATGRRRLARETYARLVLFDPRNFMNHYELAACLVRQNRVDEALTSLDRVMEINPSHLPTVRLLVRAHFEKADWREVVRVWESYLDALLFAEVRLVWRQESAVLQVPVDGRIHHLEARLPVAWNGEGDQTAAVTLTVQGFPFELEEVAAWPRLSPGRLGSRAPLTATLVNTQQIPRRGSVFVPRSSEDALQLELAAADAEVDRWRLAVRLLKPTEGETWRMVAKSYRNLLDLAGLEAARQRSLSPAPDPR